MSKRKYGLRLLFKQNSILARFFQLYVVLIVLTIGGVIYQYYQNSDINRKSDEIVKYRQAINNYCLKIDAAIHDVSFLSYNYALLKHRFIKERAEGVWEGRVVSYTKKLIELSDEFGDKGLQAGLSTLRKDILLLQDLWKKLLNPENETRKNLLETDRVFDLQVNKIKKELSDIATSQEEAIETAIANIKDTSTQLFRLTLAFVVVILLIGIIFSYLILRTFLKQNDKVKSQLNNLTEGNLSSVSEEVVEELSPLVLVSNELSTNLEELKKFAEEVGSGNFDTNVSVFGDKGVLGNALVRMQQSLQQISFENRQRNWVNEGFAKFAEILRKDSTNLDIFYDSVISNLVKYLDATQGVIFVTQDEVGKSEVFMELKAGYAYQRKKYLIKKVRQEEGVIGQVWRDKDMIFITDIPQDYSDITSGLGNAKPKSILVAPLIANENVMGVVEIASLEFLEPYKIDFVKQLSESIAATIARIKTDNATKHLLSESQSMTKRMLAQENLMRQNMEELVTTQEMLEQNAGEMELQLKALNEAFMMTEMDVEGHYIKVNDLLVDISKYSERELIGKHYAVLIGNRINNPETAANWQLLMRGKDIKGEFLMYAKDGRKFWVYEVIYPLYNTKGKIEKICTIGYDITKEKEQEDKIQDQLDQLQMSKRDVVNRIREVESKAEVRISRIQAEFLAQLKEKDRIISELMR